MRSVRLKRSVAFDDSAIAGTITPPSLSGGTPPSFSVIIMPASLPGGCTLPSGPEVQAAEVHATDAKRISASDQRLRNTVRLRLDQIVEHALDAVCVRGLQVLPQAIVL